MGGRGGGRDLDFWRHDLEIPLWAETRSRHRLVSRRVATWFWCCDLAWGWAGGTVSRPRFEVVTWIGLSGVATPI